jgi:hypothetical protein
MAEDWRVELDLEDSDGIRRLRDRLRERGVAKDAKERLGEGVAISVDGDKIFAYAQTPDQAEEAARVLSELTEANNLDGEAKITRWHPDERRWERADVPLPQTDQEREAEHARHVADEEHDSEERGVPEWEVRVEFADHDDAVAFERRLRDEGLPVVRRSRFVVLGAATEDDASALADRVRDEAPPGATVTWGGSAEAAWDETHPFGYLGGLFNV